MDNKTFHNQSHLQVCLDWLNRGDDIVPEAMI